MITSPSFFSLLYDFLKAKADEIIKQWNAKEAELIAYKNHLHTLETKLQNDLHTVSTTQTQYNTSLHNLNISQQDVAKQQLEVNKQKDDMENKHKELTDLRTLKDNIKDTIHKIPKGSPLRQSLTFLVTNNITTNNAHKLLNIPKSTIQLAKKRKSTRLITHIKLTRQKHYRRSSIEKDIANKFFLGVCYLLS